MEDNVIRAGPLSSLLIKLSGADGEILAWCPEERPRFEAVGAAVLASAGLAMLAMTFALSMGLQTPLALAAVFGVLWGLTILSIDRWLLVSTAVRPVNRAGLLNEFPRLAMAALIGLVTSVPIVLRIFEPEIASELARLRQTGGPSWTQSDGLLARMAALDSITAQQTSVAVAYWIVTLLITLIAVLPSISNLLFRLGSETAYSRLLRTRVESESRVFAERMKRLEAVRILDSEGLLAEARHALEIHDYQLLTSAKRARGEVEGVELSQTPVTLRRGRFIPGGSEAERSGEEPTPSSPSEPRSSGE